jgi:hypothetical protein
MRSPRATSSVISESSLSTFVDSPVRELSFTCKEKFSMIRPSATIISPASKSRMSPGTMPFDAISCLIPSRNTFAFGADNSFKESRDFSAFTYWIVPRIAFMIITANITIVLSMLPDAIETIAAAIRMITSRSANW